MHVGRIASNWRIRGVSSAGIILIAAALFFKIHQPPVSQRAAAATTATFSHNVPADAGPDLFTTLDMRLSWIRFANASAVG
jgi:hypothetical protein